jgi:hypothetical protein
MTDARPADLSLSLDYRDALVGDALDLACRLLSDGVTKNLFDQVVSPFLTAPSPGWRAPLKRMLLALDDGAKAGRSRKLDRSCRRLAALLMPLLDDRERSDESARLLLGYVRWRMRGSAADGALLDACRKAPRAPSARELRAREEGERHAAMTPSERLREQLGPELDKPVNEQHQVLENLQRQGVPQAWSEDPSGYLQELRQTFAVALAELDHAASGAAASRLKEVEAEVAVPAKRTKKQQKELDNRLRKLRKEAEKEAKSAARFAPLRAWLRGEDV